MRPVFSLIKRGGRRRPLFTNSTSIEFHGYSNLMLIGRGLPTNFFFFNILQRSKMALLLNFHQDLLKPTSLECATLW